MSNMTTHFNGSEKVGKDSLQSNISLKNRHKILLELALTSGMRIGEILKLEIEDLPISILKDFLG